MTKAGYRHYIVIADRSASIGEDEGFRREMEGGINQFIQDRKDDPGTATVTLHQFDIEQETVYSFRPVQDAPVYHLRPRGSTALWDAIGLVFNTEGQKLADMPEEERPEQVLVLIATDGKNNASKEYSSDEPIRAMVRHQREAYGWEVTYIGTNQDAIAVGSSVGVTARMSMDYAPSASGVRAALKATSDMAGRGARGMSLGYTQDERAAAAGTWKGTL